MVHWRQCALVISINHREALEPNSHSVHPHAFSPSPAYIFQLFFLTGCHTIWHIWHALHCTLGRLHLPFSCESPASDKETSRLHTVLTVCPLSGGSFPNTVCCPRAAKTSFFPLFHTTQSTLSFLSYVPSLVRPFPHHNPHHVVLRIDSTFRLRFQLSTPILFISHHSICLFLSHPANESSAPHPRPLTHHPRKDRVFVIIAEIQYRDVQQTAIKI